MKASAHGPCGGGKPFDGVDGIELKQFRLGVKADAGDFRNNTQTLEASARPLFARRVQAALAEKYQHFLPRFPGRGPDDHRRQHARPRLALVDPRAACAAGLLRIHDRGRRQFRRAAGDPGGAARPSRAGATMSVMALPDRVVERGLGGSRAQCRDGALLHRPADDRAGASRADRRGNSPSSSMTGRKPRPRLPPCRRRRQLRRAGALRDAEIPCSCSRPAVPSTASFRRARPCVDARGVRRRPAASAVVNALRLRLALDFARFV